MFSVDDLYALAEVVGEAWLAGADRDWSVAAGRLEWSCAQTADHAVDCVFAPAFFLASRRTDRYPPGEPITAGRNATPHDLVELLGVATRILAAVVAEAPPDTRAILFPRPTPITGPPADFVPRGALELILHAHDVCAGLGVPFDPPADLCRRLRDHTAAWPLWTLVWHGLPSTDDPWTDLLTGSGRA